MDELKPPGGSGAAERMLVIAVAQTEALAHRLHELVSTMEAGKEPPPAEIKKTVLEYRAAIRLAMEERNRFEDLCKAETGRDDGLDFDRARDEIRRRLARLRTAGDGGDVPGGAG